MAGQKISLSPAPSLAHQRGTYLGNQAIILCCSCSTCELGCERRLTKRRFRLSSAWGEPTEPLWVIGTPILRDANGDGNGSETQ